MRIQDAVWKVYGFLFFLTPTWVFVARDAQAFPETVRHEYVSCSVCHVSPSGGGMLTSYGRGLATEILATWGTETEPLPLHGAVNLPESLLVGGGLRSVQTYTDTTKFRQGKYFLMQAELELAWANDTWTVMASAGLDIGSPDVSTDDKWVSARHYVMANINENLKVRVGRFSKAYGLNIPNHTTQIKRGLGWDEGSETYNAEVNYFTENYMVTFTGIGGRPDDKSVGSEKGFAVSAHYLHLKPGLRVGGSYFSGRATDGTNREILGPDFTLAVSKRVYLMGEYDLVRVAPASGDLIEGFVTYTRAGCEIVKGLDVTFSHEVKKNDRTESQLSFEGYGPGLMWSPRPHFIVTGEWQKQKKPQFDSKAIDSAWLVFQYWL